MRLRRSPRFDKDLADLDPLVRRRALDALYKLLSNPGRRGLNLEKLTGVDDLYSVRVNRNYRIIMRRGFDSEGELFGLLRVRPHDAAYRL